MLNSVIMMGRLTDDPQLRNISGDSKVASFTIAVDRSYVRQGEERKTDFFDVTAWNRQADFASRFFRKGQLIAVQGRMETRTYDDRNGVRRKAYDIVAESLHFAEPKRDGAPAAPKYDQPAQPASFVNGAQDEFTEITPPDDDLPF